MKRGSFHQENPGSDAATRKWHAKQDTKTHQGRKQSSFSAPLKSQPRDATGGYNKNPKGWKA